MTRIAAIDDSHTMRLIYEKALAHEPGYAVATFANAEALMAELQPFDIVIVDTSRAADYEQVSFLRQQQACRESLFIIAVSEHSPFRADFANAVKARAFLYKPFLVDELLQVLSEVKADPTIRVFTSSPPPPIRSQGPTPAKAAKPIPLFEWIARLFQRK